MKARVKATGEIVEVSMECNNSTDFRKAIFRTKDCMSYRYDDVELIFDKIVEPLDVKENSFPKDDLDYWTRLEHQAAIAAMQGLCANTKFMRDHEGDFQCNEDMIAVYAKDIAHALVEKMKEANR